jgi:hypothetical protein
MTQGGALRLAPLAQGLPWAIISRPFRAHCSTFRARDICLQTIPRGHLQLDRVLATPSAGPPPLWEPGPPGDPLTGAHCAAQAAPHRANRAHAVAAPTVLPDEISDSLLPFLTAAPWTLTPRHAILLSSALWYERQSLVQPLYKLFTEATEPAGDSCR